MIHSIFAYQALNIKYHLGCFLFLCVIVREAHGQSMFNNITNASNIMHSYQGEYGTGASFVDFNNDGWDDITVCDNYGIQFYENDNGQFSLITPPVELESTYKQVTWVDFDNDGDKDLFCSGEYVPMRLFERISDFTFQEITWEAGLPETNARTNGHSWGDYNKDGFLDLFVCNYDHQTYSNWIFKNNGDGTFTDLTEDLGFSDLLEFSFQSVFFDFNDDGWQDLFVINDKILHPNRLYKNVNGIFEDVTQSAGMEYIVNSMCSSVADFNNDGSMDVYVSDGEENLLHKNNGDGTFTEISESAGLSNLGLSWSGLFADVDNNQLLDLIICTSTESPGSGENYLFLNSGDETFDQSSLSGFGSQLTDTYCAIKGDTDNDGYCEIFMTGANENHSVLMNNQSSGANHLKLELQGTVSNRDGIGSKVELWTDSVRQTKYTHCGEGYLGQNSNTMIFGLGESTYVDSLKVTWLSGVVDKLYGLAPNQKIEMIEGSTLSNQIQVNGELSLCEGDSTILSAGNFESYLWNTGDTSSTITVNSTGAYSVLVTDSFGFQINSDTVSIADHPNPLIAPSVENITCFGDSNGSILLENLAGSPVEICDWSNSMTGVFIDSLPPGQYNYDFLDIYGCSASGTISIAEPNPLQLSGNTTNQVGDEPGSAEIVIDGGTPPYTIYWSNGAENTFSQDSLYAGIYGVWIVDANNCKTYGLLFIDFIQSLIEQSTENLIVYPNPFSNQLQVDHIPRGADQLEIRSIDGKSLKERIVTPNSSSITLDLKDLSSGIYFLSIYHEAGIITTEIVKE